MVVTDEQAFDTIGGGKLEYLALQRARELLAQKKADSAGSSFSFSGRSKSVLRRKHDCLV